MKEDTRNQLEAKLRRMLDEFDQAKATRNQSTPRSGKGNIIRRRAGEKEKRFSVCV
jgi:hypothetical protein